MPDSDLLAADFRRPVQQKFQRARDQFGSFRPWQKRAHGEASRLPATRARPPTPRPLSDDRRQHGGRRAYHPILALVACFGKGSVVFFNRETGERETGRINDADIAGETPQRVFFAPDGKSVLVETTVQSIHYLYRLPLKLSAEETRTVTAVPRPDKPMDASEPAPVPAAPPGKLPQMRAALPASENRATWPYDYPECHPSHEKHRTAQV